MHRVVVAAASTAVPFLSFKIDRPRFEHVSSSAATAPVCPSTKYAGLRGRPLGYLSAPS